MQEWSRKEPEVEYFEKNQTEFDAFQALTMKQFHTPD